MRTPTLIATAALICLSIARLDTLQAQQSANDRLSEEASKQSGIYESRGAAVPQGYVIDRSLLSYTFILPSEFNQSLADLRPGDRWLDVGAGQGRAILDYSTSKYDVLHAHAGERNGAKAQAVALSIEDRRTPQWYEVAAKLEPKQIQYVFGRRLREYSRDELGEFRLITDVIGGFSYTRQLSTYMQKALSILQLSGKLYTVLQDVHAENGVNKPYYPDAPFLTEIVDAEGSELKICSWLKSITCVEVSCESKPAFSPPAEVYRVRKVCENVSVPRLEIVHFQAGTPPERRFRLVR